MIRWVQSNFTRRAMRFSHNDKLTRPSYCRVRMDGIEGGSIHAERRASA
jgi:hypothetical protein